MAPENNLVTFEISRPVIHGLEGFMPIVRNACAQHIPDDLRHGILAGETSENDDVWQTQRAVGGPRYNVYNKLMSPIVSLVALRKSRNTALFHNLAKNIVQQRGGKISKSQAALQAIPEQLTDVMYQFGDVSPSLVRAHCGGISISQSLNEKDYELSLVLEDGTRFIEEHDVYIRALMLQSNLSDHSNLLSPYFARVAIARISKETSIEERAKLTKALRREGLESLTFQFGAIEDPFVR